MKYKVNFSCGKSYRPKKGEVIDNGEKQMFGFCWFFWVPLYVSNGGKFRKNDVVDINICWLFFWVSVTFWPNRKVRVEVR